MTLAGTLIIVCLYVVHKSIQKASFLTIKQIEERLLANEKGVEGSFASSAMVKGI
jgi:hypothetical protein